MGNAQARRVPGTVFMLGLLGLLQLTPASGSTVYSYTGDLRTNATFTDCGLGCTLSSDSDYAQFAAVVETFVVTASSSMEAITFSYGGGTNGQGAGIAQGGFEPYLSLFDSSGNFLASTFYGTTCPAGANTNSSSGLCFDVQLDGGTLAPGTYSIAISAFENMSYAENLGSVYTLSDGFTGLGNLASGEDLHFAFDVILNDGTSVPEPGTIGGVAMVLLGLYSVQRKLRKQS